MFVVIGATGKVGSHVAERLLRRGQFDKINVQNVEQAYRLSQLGAIVHVGDIDNLRISNLDSKMQILYI